MKKVDQNLKILFEESCFELANAELRKMAHSVSIMHEWYGSGIVCSFNISLNISLQQALNAEW